MNQRQLQSSMQEHLVYNTFPAVTRLVPVSCLFFPELKLYHACHVAKLRSVLSTHQSMGCLTNHTREAPQKPVWRD